MKKLIILLILLFLVTGASAGWLEDSLGLQQQMKLTVSPTDAPILQDVAVVPTLTGELSRVAINTNGLQADRETNGLSQTNDRSISVFQSWADNLIPVTKLTVRVFVSSGKGITSLGDNTRMPTISGDGNWIAYEYSPNYEEALPELHVMNTQTGKDQFIDYTSGGNQYGWTTQNFTITNNSTVSYLTTYPNETGFIQKSITFNSGGNAT